MCKSQTPQAEHERDEALAQVVVLRRLIHHGPFDHDYVKDEQRCDTCRILTDVPTEARALLARLEKAKAVVRAAESVIEHEGPHLTRYAALREAIAAYWERA